MLFRSRVFVVQSAGADHLSRAKAVEALEQQFAALHRGLKIWRSDRSAYDPKVMPRWDYRFSRYQVAQAIEQGWKGMTRLFDHQRRSVPALSLDGMLHDPLPTLPTQVNFEHVRLLSLGKMALADTAAAVGPGHAAARRTNQPPGRRLGGLAGALPEIGRASCRERV